MPTTFHQRVFLISILLWLMCLPACTTLGTDSIDTSVTQLPDNPISTVAPRLRASETPTSLPVLVNTPTHSPLPTLSQSEASQRVHDLMEKNSNCQLPCLWGIVPGTTLLSDAVYRFNEFMTLKSASLIGENGDGGAEFVYPDKGPFDNAFGSLYLRSKNNIIVAMRLEGYETISQNYAIQDVLRKYGIPDNIWIYTLRDSYGEGALPFVIALDYSSLGFLSYYQGNGTPKYETGLIELCYTRYSVAPKIIVWNPIDENPFARNKSDYIYRIWSEMKPIEIASMGKEMFQEVFTKANEEQPFCLTTPSSIWSY